MVSHSFIILSWLCHLGEHSDCTTQDCNCLCHKEVIPSFCCLKFKTLVNDLDDKMKALMLDKQGKVTFVENGSCDGLDDQPYPYYNFINCPYCGTKL